MQETLLAYKIVFFFGKNIERQHLLLLCLVRRKIYHASFPYSCFLLCAGARGHDIEVTLCYVRWVIFPSRRRGAKNVRWVINLNDGSFMFSTKAVPTLCFLINRIDVHGDVLAEK